MEQGQRRTRSAASGDSPPRSRSVLGRFAERRGRWLIILPPFVFLLVFFLIPFAFALKISFAEAALRIPPFSSVLTVAPDHHWHLSLS